MNELAVGEVRIELTPEVSPGMGSVVLVLSDGRKRFFHRDGEGPESHTLTSVAISDCRDLERQGWRVDWSEPSGEESEEEEETELEVEEIEEIEELDADEDDEE